MARINVLERCKKYCGVKGSDRAKRRISLFKKHRHRLTTRTVRDIVISRATCDPIHLLYFVGLIQVIGRNAS